MNTEETLKLGRDIDAISIEAGNLSRHLARLAGRCGVKPPTEPGYLEQKKIEAALDLISSFGGTAGSHHKDWVIDQVTRALTGDGYDAFVAACCDGEDGPDTYSWEVGVAP